MATANFKDKGIEFVKKAVAEDDAGNYKDALQSYMTALQYFEGYLRWEKNQKVKETMTAKVCVCV